MKIFASLAFVMLFLAGCIPSSGYDKACSGLRGAFAVYAEVRAEAPLNVTVVVDQAFKSTIPFCDNPPQDQTEAAVRITAASLVIWKAYRSVQ
jgi:hypothetical protein